MRLAQTLLFLSYFESGTLYSRHVNSIRAIRHVRHLLPESTALTLACSLINSRLDYCSALLYGAPVSTISKLQRVQNNAAHVVVASSRRCDAKPLLRQLHWLPVRQRILYKTAMTTDDAEGFHDRCSSLPERTSCPTRCHPPDTFCCTSTADCPENKYCVCQTLIFIRCTCHLEQC